ncbi:MAG: hypothetical protein PF692_06545 [Kiritimatiellae bacterium]|jgi:hypothetical protein|nr:hypothetical protein [Kiritimatiellia bacterium]
MNNMKFNLFVFASLIVLTSCKTVTIKQKEETEMKPPMYTDMKETQFIKWNLEYTEPYLIETFKSFPENTLLTPPKKGMEPPALIFANRIVKEAIHIQGFNQGKIDVPEDYKCLLWWQGASSEEKLKSISNRDDLIKFSEQVRASTCAYLDSLSDEKLKDIPEKSILKDNDPNRGNPIREAFVMTMYQQNVVWGKLIAIKETLDIPLTETEKWQK